MLADEMKRPINLPTVKQAASEISQFENWKQSNNSWRKSASAKQIYSLNLAENEAVLNSWRQLLDKGSLQEGEENLAGTARKTFIALSKTKAEKLNIKPGEKVKVSANNFSVTAPLKIVETDDQIVWLPRNSENSQLVKNLQNPTGIKVQVSKA
jgi:NADH-quinone oxidoreductase subunit G